MVSTFIKTQFLTLRQVDAQPLVLTITPLASSTEDPMIQKDMLVLSVTLLQTVTV